MNVLTCPSTTFQRLLRALATDPGCVPFARVGPHHVGPDREWLVRDFTLTQLTPRTANSDLFFRVTLISTPLSNSLSYLSFDQLPLHVIGDLYLGHGPYQAHLWGAVRTGEAIEPLHCLALVGPGMHSIRTLNSNIPDRSSTLDNPLLSSIRMRWSRTIGALGEEAIWQRLTQLHVGIIGCGRTGSLVAVTLARLGIRQLTLVDPDVVEIHNLGEMDAVTEADLGRAKAEVLAGHLRVLLPHYAVTPLPIVASIAHPAALAATKVCDVLFCCADNDAARLATALLATLYQRVLVDLGTGIFYRSARAEESGNSGEQWREGQPSSALTLIPPVPRLATPRTMGADVRLILPGDGCLLCWGNLTNYAQAVADLCNPQSLAGLLRAQETWQQQRAGSLRSLNQLAVALGVQMLQDLVDERLQGSVWAQVEFNAIGQLTVRYPARQPSSDSPTCALCAKAGLGDAGLG